MTGFEPIAATFPRAPMRAKVPSVSRLLVPCAFLAVFGFSSMALAAEPAVEACATLGNGDACTLPQPVNGENGLDYEESPGTCQPDECCEQDYSGGSPPKVTCGPCLMCKEGAAGPGEKVGGSAGGEPPRTSDDPPASANNAKGCTINAPGSGWTVGALLVLLGFVRRQPQ